MVEKKVEKMHLTTKFREEIYEKFRIMSICSNKILMSRKEMKTYFHLSKILVIIEHFSIKNFVECFFIVSQVNQ